MKALFLMVMLTSVTFSQAQDLFIKGKIIDYGTNEPVPYTTIQIPKTNFKTISDSIGNFQLPFSDNLIGSYLVVHSQDYQLDSMLITKNDQSMLVSLKKANDMEEVVISGTMKEVYRVDSPVPIEIYTPTFFKKNPTPNLFAALETVNGVRPQMNCNVCNTGDIHINGMEGAYTMVMIDGMPIVSALSTVYGLMGIPNSMVERIEVIKGPASTLYGSEAVGGLINVITKNPRKAPLISVDLNATSYQEYNTDISAKMRLGRAHALFSANYFHYDKPVDYNQDNFTDITLQKRFSFFNKWSFDRKENRLASLGYRVVLEDRWGGEMQWSPVFKGTDSIYGESIATRRFELFGNYQLPSKERLVFTYSYNFHHQNSAYGNTLYEALQQIGFSQLTWDKKLNKHNLLSGLALRYTFYDDNTPVTQSHENPNLNQASNVFLPGIFIQDELKLNDKNKVLLGLRYDYNTDHGSILSPRLNYQKQWKKHQNLRVSLGNGYRVVNLFSEDHSALNGAREVVVLEDLKPEKSYNSNINYTTKITKSNYIFFLDASIFYTYFSNKIIADYLTDPNKVIFDNLKGYGISRGLTLNTDLNFPFGLKLITGITLMDVFTEEPNDNQESVRIPQLQASPFSGTWTISYLIPAWQLSIDYTGNVYSPMHLPVLPNDFRPEMSPWFSIQNIQLTKKFKKGLEIYGGVKNLLNFLPEYPIMRPFDPFDKNVLVNNPNNYTFDPSYNFASVQKIRGFLGLRWNFR
jgi:outer membrane receptor for ferrienterochelin and colicins